MRFDAGVLVVLMGCATCFAQLSTDEAYQRLREREKQHAAASQPSQQAAPRPNQAERGKLLHEAWSALMEKRYAAAIPMFDRAIAIDQKDTVAIQGRAICRYELKQYKAADRDAELAYNLSGRSGSSGPSRQEAILLAATSAMNDNPMRAVRILRGRLEALDQESKLDEQLQDFLGIALSKASAQSRKQPYFQESLKYYMDYDQKLAQDKKDGTSRWGSKWVEVGSAEKKWTEYQTAVAQAELAASAHDHSVLAVTQARENVIELHGLALHSDAERVRWTNQYKAALANEQGARVRQAKAVDHLAHVEKPPFPDRIECDWQEPR